MKYKGCVFLTCKLTEHHANAKLPESKAHTSVQLLSFSGMSVPREALGLHIKTQGMFFIIPLF